MNKRGLSDIIATVLIVLLALVAVAILWVFISNPISKAGVKIGSDSQFIGTRFSIVPGSVGVVGGNVGLILERKSGGGELAGFIVVLEDSTGKTFSYDLEKDTGFNVLERKKISIDISSSGLADVDKIYVYPTVFDDNEELVSSAGAVFEQKVVSSVSATCGDSDGICPVGCSYTADSDVDCSYCGDNIIQSPNSDGDNEVCDGGAQACLIGGYDGTQNCNLLCTGYNVCATTESCGDGILNGPEQCDDSNLVDGDGCSSGCMNEGGGGVYALSFDGVDDNVDMGDPDFVEGVTEFTVSAWMKSDVSSKSVNSPVVSQEGPSTDTFLLYWDSSENVRFTVWSDTANPSDQITDGIMDTNWHHVVGRLNAGEVEVFVDGVGSGAPELFTGVTKATSNTFTIGEGVGFFDGLIDDVRIYNVGLNDAQIATLNSNGRDSSSDPGNLIGHWKFNEGSGTTVGNSVGGNSGTINGATWVVG